MYSNRGSGFFTSRRSDATRCYFRSFFSINSSEPMSRYRVTISGGPEGIGQLRCATELRDELIDRGQVWVDPEFPLQGIHRNSEGMPYFEFTTTNREAISDVLNRAENGEHARLTETDEPLGEPCQDCGNIAGSVLPPVCPNCGFLDISPCPVCGENHARQNYEKISGNLFYCPTRRGGVRHRVRLIFNEPMFRPDGRFNQPLVLVKEAASHAVRS